MNGTPSSNAQSAQIGVLVRVIAAGIERRGSKLFGLATLSLMPQAANRSEAFARSIALKNWPDEIESMLADARLFVCPVDPSTEGLLQPGCSCQGPGIQVHRSATLSQDQRRKANALWQDLISGGDDTLWSNLVTVLERSQTGSSLEDVKPETNKPRSDPKNTPDVFEYPRGDAALLYGLQRAREVLRAMQGKAAECHINRCVIKTGGRRLDHRKFTFEQKPWLGLAQPVEASNSKTWSEASPPPLPQPTVLTGFDKVNDLLKSERETQEPIYRETLADKTQKAKEQTNQRVNYLTGPTVKERIEALKAHAAARATSLPPADCANACGGSTDDSVANELTDQVKSAHSLGSLPDVDGNGDVITDPKQLNQSDGPCDALVRRRFFAISAMPSLARLFNLVIDVEFDLNDLLHELDLDPQSAVTSGFKETGAIDHYGDLAGVDKFKKTRGEAVYAHYMFLTSNLGRADFSEGAGDPTGGRDPSRVWTLAKFRMPGDSALTQAGHFWPCTREEVDIRLSQGTDGDIGGTAVRDSCAVFQYDGVVDLGVTYCLTNGTKNPRYDIVSIDTIQVVQSDIQSDRRLQQQAGAATNDRQTTTELGVQTQRTGGLAVVDRWRQDHVVSQIATAQSLINAPGSQQAAIVLDAEDMTGGYRLDVGIDRGKGSELDFRWRCLMNRTMKFESRNCPGDWLEQAIDALYRWGNATKDCELATENRRRADSATLSVASRLRSNGLSYEPKKRGVTTATTAFAEQTMIAWHGDPLGLECTDMQGVASSDQCGNQIVFETPDGICMRTDDLPLELWYGLETSKGNDAYCPPPLRYGWPYHLGLRPVYLGGVVLPIELAISRYQANFDTGSALPSPQKQAGRRFLRHERIESPILTVPEGIADLSANLTPDQIKNDPARRDNGATCILRTSLADKNAKADALGPPSTVRILFPPIMPFDQAALHGVFDSDRVEDVRVAQVDEKGRPLKDEDGEPVFRCLKRPPDGLKQLDFTGDRRSGSGRPPGGFPHYIYKDSAASGDPRGPAVFRFDGKTPREIPFYPDPSATSYVIKARRPRSDDYLDGCIVVPAYSATVKYPNVLPLALEIKKAARRSKPVQCILDLFQGDCSEIAHANAKGMLGASSGGLPVRHAVAQLPPGEDLEIEVWCIPSAQELRRKFDIVESIAVLLTRDSAAEELADGQLDQACIDGLRKYFPELPSAELPTAEDLLSKLGAAYNPLCGPGSMSLPQPALMDEIAQRILNVLSDRPIPEVAATTRIHVIHAVDKTDAPKFLDVEQPWQGVRVVRLNDNSFKALMGDTSVTPPPNTARLESSPLWNDLSDDGATNVIFDGNVQVDLLTTHDVEMRATMVSPASAVFDDVNRGRTTEEKARGAYRPFGWTPSPKGPEWPPLLAEAVEKDSRQLFGFTVGADGRVQLCAYQAPLVRLHNLPDVPVEQRNSAFRCFGLLDEQRIAYPASVEKTSPGPVASGAEEPTRIQYVQPFRDGLARQLKLELVATSRFNNLFPDPDPAAAKGRETASEPISVWLPATKRPDPLSAKSLRPCFTWTYEPSKSRADSSSVARAVRNCAIRVPFDRPHFTSGEGERVGIVVWPPDLMLSGRADEIANDKVRRSERPGHLITLDDVFSDSDLGPGGEYTTRWGADPIREGPRPGAWLIPAQAFLDLNDPTSTGAVLESNVLMPIPRKPNANGAESQNADTAGREFMLVSLLTYEPRFDIDYERWYIDVRIDAGKVPEPFIRLGLVRFQKHARPELQVSEPIAEWITVMQKRDVCVSVAPPDDPRRVNLSIEVGTPAVYEGHAPQFDLDSDEPDTPGTTPFLRAYVLRTDQLAGGGSIQTIVAPSDTVTAQSTELLPQRTPAGTAWTGTIGLARNALQGSAGTSYAVYIEEVEAYSPTANPFDPDSGEARPTVVESGPRFAAIVPVSLPAASIAAPATRTETVASKAHKTPHPPAPHQKPTPAEETYR